MFTLLKCIDVCANLHNNSQTFPDSCLFFCVNIIIGFCMIGQTKETKILGSFHSLTFEIKRGHLISRQKSPLLECSFVSRRSSWKNLTIFKTTRNVLQRCLLNKKKLCLVRRNVRQKYLKGAKIFQICKLATMIKKEKIPPIFFYFLLRLE